MNDIVSGYANIAPFAAIILLGLLIALAYWTFQVQSRLDRALRHYRQLTSGVRAGSLDQVLAGQVARIDHVESDVAEFRDRQRRLELLQQISLQRVGVVRFNPFRDVGGDQSFAIALLDGRDTGLVISSLFIREGVRIYAKPIENGRSPYQLTEEETRAIHHAKTGTPLLSALQASESRRTSAGTAELPEAE